VTIKKIIWCDYKGGVFLNTLDPKYGVLIREDFIWCDYTGGDYRGGRLYTVAHKSKAPNIFKVYFCMYRINLKPIKVKFKI